MTWHLGAVSFKCFIFPFLEYSLSLSFVVLLVFLVTRVLVGSPLLLATDFHETYRKCRVQDHYPLSNLTERSIDPKVLGMDDHKRQRCT